PTCQARPSGAPGTRYTTNCTHLFCKKCCTQFQRDGASTCALQSHSIPRMFSAMTPATSQVPTADPTVPSLRAPDNSAVIPPATPSHNQNRPLRKEHYDRREQAEIQQQILINRRTEAKAAEALSNLTVSILFWKNAGCKPAVIQVPCHTFPHFSLSKCSTAVQRILGINEDPDQLLETFDIEQAAWVLQDHSVSRTLSERISAPKVLYRLPESLEGPSWDDCQNMQEEVDRLVEIAASSGHANWPLKYVTAMADGFNKMSTMKGSLPCRFEASFNANFPKQTYNDNFQAWNAASREVKERYVQAGYSDAGLWKNFRKEVQASF
ncbi:hypothetical protein BJ912DRAFT_835210, partial [Pholiota molesta]